MKRKTEYYVEINTPITEREAEMVGRAISSIIGILVVEECYSVEMVEMLFPKEKVFAGIRRIGGGKE